MKPGTKGATPFADLPIHPDRKRTYVEAEVLPRVRAWASSDGSGDKEKMDWAKFRKAFFWYDPEAAEDFGSYKLKFGDVVDGKLYAVWAGVHVAAGAIQGARGGVNIPDADRAAVRTHIGRYYAKARKEFDDDTIVEPWKKAAGPSTEIEFKSYPAEFNADISQRTIEGYAAVFGNVDSWGDVIERGAFAKTLQEQPGRIKCCWQHDWTWPIGKPVLIEEDAKGLSTMTRIAQTRAGDDALALCAEGIVTEMSIGYNTIKSLMDEEAGIRYLQEVRLFEYSPVTWAANELAVITGVKGRGNLALALKRFAAAHAALKDGRALTARNRDLAEGAIEALQALLDSAVADGEPDGESTRAADGDPGAADGPEEKVLEEIAAGLTDFVGVHGIRQDLEQFSRQLARGR
jgi:hypothetical protein